jgi:hypothetical protein
MMKHSLMIWCTAALALSAYVWAEELPPKTEGAEFTIAKTETVGEFTFAETEGWKAQKSTKMMVKSSFVKTGADGKTSLEVNFYHFGAGQGGDVGGNIKRWEGMFSAEPAVTTTKEDMAFGSRQATLVKIAGTYQGSMMSREAEPKPDYVLVGAVLPSESAGHVFARMVGPKAEVEAAYESLKKLLLSGAPK